ncbi:magnesium transporter [Amylibacter sp.]|jgi:magnesium transporter|nr:magnesium transporter [Amylibacter sp.]MDA9005088.1 magnesium transporter [Amylibacter sp.]MDA9075206.1 magnesium transporter [Amylibacter sp.]MDA9242858.1 magnesium transporter [Amylibacter sp.]MDA9293277.1 magnesium transporter [Amylibacter sp.]|tara:strand:+ start:88 stop:1470 length:1383 start_codon:yes stop_codon:yes gene_type:complete
MEKYENIQKEAPDRAYEMDSYLIDTVLTYIDDQDKQSLITLLNEYHPADIADLFEQINPHSRSALMELWGKEMDGEVFAEMDEGLSGELIEEMSDEVVSLVLKDLETDDVVDLLEDLEKDEQNRLIDVLDASGQIAVLNSLKYPEGTAGRLMARELVMAPTHWNVGQTIDNLRKSKNLPSQFYDVVVVDPMSKPIGKVTLSTLLRARRSTPLIDLVDEEFRTIPVSQSQEDVAYAFNQYNMVSAPVVDDENRLVGVITMDDAMEVLGDEADEDIKLLGGVGDESLTDTILVTARQRFPWLGINLLTSILASIVIAQFSSTIEAIVALAVLMPIVASMGGNAGTQTLTVAVRALATKDLTSANAWRVIRREALVGLLNGLVFAIIIGLIGYYWYGFAMLGAVLAMAMILNLLMAGLAGILVPLMLDKFKMDPALGSSALVTTVTDIIGFFAFLGLASAILL